ncbi:hypothetical protein [Eleftheria terrae]|uniref:hypothetical protein n=1 Tax=Eleftheria terrae TaxID=1597781 RepID=UPI00263B83A7|nr:hypothetical protein [Eleftheria terrae]WKB51336.1 hypothetical protein N7L95_16165 [Eleftheria terrae]
MQDERRQGAAAACRRPLLWAWLAWGLVSVLMAAYYGAGQLASSPVSVPLRLQPGQAVSVDVRSVFGHTLAMGVQFGLAPRHLPLEPAAGEGAGGDAGLRLQSHAGAVQVEVSARHREDHHWVALPQPPGATLRLPPGLSRVQVTVRSVAPSLQGEPVRLLVQAPVGFETTQRGYGWLWFYWLALPVFVLSQYIWALVLVKSQRRHAAGGDAPAPRPA